MSYQRQSCVWVEYVDNAQFRRIAKFLKIMEDLKEGVPRTAYLGVVYGNFDIILDHFFAHVSAPPQPTRAVGRVLLGAQADLMPIGACNPMVYPIWGFRSLSYRETADSPPSTGVRIHIAPARPWAGYVEYFGK